MKKFKYSLESVLKLRRFKEDKIKIELGEINSEIVRLEDYIKKIKKNINDGFTDQETILETRSSVNEIKVYGEIFMAGKIKIDQLKIEIEHKQIELEKKRKELNLARAEVKVLEEQREKKYKNYKYEISKKQSDQIEDQVNMIRLTRSNG
jgi:flagellar protein FliJ